MMPAREEMARDAALRQVPMVLDKIATALGVQTQRDDDADTNTEAALARITAALSTVDSSLEQIAGGLEVINDTLRERNDIAKEQVRATMAHAAIVLSTSVAAGGESIEFSDALAAVKAIMDEVRTYE